MVEVVIFKQWLEFSKRVIRDVGGLHKKYHKGAFNFRVAVDGTKLDMVMKLTSQWSALLWEEDDFAMSEGKKDGNKAVE